jgi:hypothetical protein
MLIIKHQNLLSQMARGPFSLPEEHDKCVNTERSLDMEIKKNEIMSSELSSCRDSILVLRT